MKKLIYILILCVMITSCATIPTAQETAPPGTEFDVEKVFVIGVGDTLEEAIDDGLKNAVNEVSQRYIMSTTHYKDLVFEKEETVVYKDAIIKKYKIFHKSRIKGGTKIRVQLNVYVKVHRLTHGVRIEDDAFTGLPVYRQIRQRNLKKERITESFFKNFPMDILEPQIIYTYTLDHLITTKPSVIMHVSYCYDYNKLWYYRMSRALAALGNYDPEDFKLKGIGKHYFKFFKAYMVFYDDYGNVLLKEKLRVTKPIQSLLSKDFDLFRIIGKMYRKTFNVPFDVMDKYTKIKIEFEKIS